MITVRPSEERGHFNHGWLDARHTFSFADYHDPKHMGFRSLRVINEDRVMPGQGFGKHPHRDMEILTYVLSGELEHRDSLGNGAIIRPGEVQYMAAGTGILHSEFNPSASAPVHLLQIWIVPSERGATPRYEQKMFPGLTESGRLTLLASPDGRDGSIRMHQDAMMYAATLRHGEPLHHSLRDGRAAWAQVVRGELSLNDHRLVAGDGASTIDQGALTMSTQEHAEVLLFDLG